MTDRLGRVQRQIARAFLANPGGELRTVDLAKWAFPRLQGEPQRKHRSSIGRAAPKVAERVRRDRPGGVVYRAKRSQSLPSTPDCGSD